MPTVPRWAASFSSTLRLPTNNYDPSITSLSNGDFVVSWTDYSGQGGDSSGSIKAQIFRTNSAPVITTTAIQTLAENTTAVTTVTAPTQTSGRR